MDISKVLGVMAEGTAWFFDKITYLDTYLIAGVFMAIVTALAFVHIVFGSKATSSRRAHAIAKYFNNFYIGSSLDAKRFLKKKWYLLNNRAKSEFVNFMRSNMNIATTDFAREVLRPGKNSLDLVLGCYSVAIVISTIFIAIKGVLGGLSGLNLMFYVGMPLAGLMIVKGILFFLVRIVARCYKADKKRLYRALPSVRYNNEFVANRPIVNSEDIMQGDQNERASKVEEVIARMQEIDSTMNGDTEVALLEGVEAVKDSLNDVDKAKYDVLLSTLRSKHLADGTANNMKA